MMSRIISRIMIAHATATRRITTARYGYALGSIITRLPLNYYFSPIGEHNISINFTMPATARYGYYVRGIERGHNIGNTVIDVNYAAP